MKSSMIPIFMCFLACASARSIYGVAVPNYPCTSGSDDVSNHYPNSYNASTFFQCTEFGLVLMPCPAGLEFNVELDRCDWPIEATPESSEEVIPDKTEAPVPESSEFEEVTSTQSPDPNGPGCPTVSCDFNGQYISNPSDCHSFYQCSWGVPLLQQCAMETATTRLVFNPELNVCVWSREYPCNEC